MTHTTRTTRHDPQEHDRYRMAKCFD
jgi:hypothetical protein